jgi:Holliday junction resolvase
MEGYIHPILRQKAAGTRGGCFDVLAWRDNQFIFLEAKRKYHDKIRDTQRRWIEAAISTGVASDKLIVVEWSSS